MTQLFQVFYPDLIIDSIYHIDLETLQKNDIKGLIIDIDNTLVAWDVKQADELSIQWIQRMKEKGIRVCLVSNNTRDRVIKFNEQLKLFAVHSANKPSKRPFLKALKHLETLPHQTAVIGDQVFTDVWGANRLDMFSILVTPISPKEFPLIRIKRFFEKKVLKEYHAHNKKNKASR